MKWYVWKCNAENCNSTLTINYYATEEDYHRFKKCGCKENGLFEWQYNYHDYENAEEI
jgi:hypothetical protein